MSIILLTGGARSGKSSRALALAQESGAETFYFVATAQAFDQEMQDRIAQHRAERSQVWATIEAPIDLPNRLQELDPNGCILVDCLTLWLSNLLLNEADIEAEIEALLKQLARPRRGCLIFVSNEVGMGIVPENALARRFRDLQGRLNQRLAALAERVEFMVSGLPMRIK